MINQNLEWDWDKIHEFTQDLRKANEEHHANVWPDGAQERPCHGTANIASGILEHALLQDHPGIGIGTGDHQRDDRQYGQTYQHESERGTSSKRLLPLHKEGERIEEQRYRAKNRANAKGKRESLLNGVRNNGAARRYERYEHGDCQDGKHHSHKVILKRCPSQPRGIRRCCTCLALCCV